MRQKIPYSIDVKSLSWPQRILAGAVGVGVVLLGLALGALILGLAAAVGLVIAARIWWLRRRLRAAARNGQADSSVIETEYHVIEHRREPRGWDDQPR